MQPQLEIKAEQLEGSADILKIFLGDEFILYGKTRIAHWNVEGPGLLEKQKFFEEQYGQLDKIMDSVAERIRALGHYVPFTVERFFEYSFDRTRMEEKRCCGIYQGFVIRSRKYCHPPTAKPKHFCR